MSPPRPPPGERQTAPPRPNRDLGTCPLALRTYELGDGASTFPSAPAVAGDGFVVAYTRFVDPHYELVTQRVGSDGVLAGPVSHGDRPGPWVPVLAGSGDRVVLIAGGGKHPDETRLDPATGAAISSVVLPDWPDAMAVGPRTIVTSSVEGGQRTIRRAGAPDITVPSTDTRPVPDEELVASGPTVDVALVRTDTRGGHVVSTVVLEPGKTLATYELIRTRRDPASKASGRSEYDEVSIAAGPTGFLVARTGPTSDRLELYRLDASGRRLGDPVIVAALPNEVTRYPRVASLGTGWLVTYWDGVGSTLVRLDADARPFGERIPLRSGDERGGHTDARIAVSRDAIAVSWLVAPPGYSHGLADEEPKHPGPRLGILTCSVTP